MGPALAGIELRRPVYSVDNDPGMQRVPLSHRSLYVLIPGGSPALDRVSQRAPRATVLPSLCCAASPGMQRGPPTYRPLATAVCTLGTTSSGMHRPPRYCRPPFDAASPSVQREQPTY